MFRKFTSSLDEWDRSNRDEPLLLMGVRQVGKTWLIKDFCDKRYKDYVYINLEESPGFVSVFDGDLDPKSIIRGMEQMLGRTITPDVPVVIDEIQQSERAVTSLKYFCESNIKYKIIGSGSLLGVKIKRFEGSFPVGKVIIRELFPMDFEEFLLAVGEKQLRDGIKDAYLSCSPMIEGLHNKALKLYHDYIMVGGMPKAVKAYIDSGFRCDTEVRDVHSQLELAYMADMTKYTTSAAEGV